MLEKSCPAALQIDQSILWRLNSVLGFRLAAGAVGLDPWRGGEDATELNVKFEDLIVDYGWFVSAAAR